MCGIAGFLGTVRDAEDVARRMIERIAHRGPDGQAVWSAPDAPLTFAHARLSVIDLGPGGNQPMSGHDGRYTLVYNGEIYNYRELRALLDRERPRRWRGSSDTEVLLAAFEEWGVEEALARLVGMFAIAVWDARRRRLSLIRDRFGEKPLYVQCLSEGVLFASELGALAAHPQASREVDGAALAMYCAQGVVPAPRTILHRVFKVEPGTLWHVDEHGTVERRIYYDVAAVAAAGVARPFDGDDREAVDELERLLGRAVEGQMIADVPLGTFLSGGIDSSLVAATMCSRASGAVRTFSIGFDAAEFDEAPYAASVAERLGTEHTELYVDSDTVLAEVAALPARHSEPFADSSQLPTGLVAALARRSVTVALSGDAGDEVLCGYNRYRFAMHGWPRLRRVPRPLRALLGHALSRVPPGRLDAILRVLPGFAHLSRPGERLHRGAALLASPDLAALYAGLTSVWLHPERVLRLERAPPELPSFLRPALDAVPAGLDDAQWMMLADQRGYLPDDILAKVDRAAMAVSLETRVPFLDHRLVEFAWSLPPSMRLRGGRTKWLSGALLSRYLSAELIERPKMGFSVPLAKLLRGPLRDWAQQLLDPRAMADDGHFRPESIAQLWKEHLVGRADHSARLWVVLMFRAWRLEHGS